MQLVSPATDSTAVPRARRLIRPTFSLRTLLLGIALVGCGLGMFQRLDRQRQLVARIQAAGGVCEIRRQESSGSVETLLRKWLSPSYFDDVCIIFFNENTIDVDGILVSNANRNVP